jgi:hypothetical protein
MKKEKYTKVSYTHSWTKDEIKKLAKLWTSHNIDDIATEMGLQKTQVSYMANAIRKIYPNLMPRKHRNGQIGALIRETLGK